MSFAFAFEDSLDIQRNETKFLCLRIIVDDKVVLGFIARCVFSLFWSDNLVVEIVLPGGTDSWDLLFAEFNGFAILSFFLDK